MSKAFTKEDDDGGFVLVPASAAAPAGRFRLTGHGARALRARADAGDARAREALARAKIVTAPEPPGVAALGVTVTVERDGAPARYRLVSPEELALLGDGCSVQGPLGRALLGARAGDVVELELAGKELELVVLELHGERAPDADG